MNQDAIDAFWADARIRARLNRMSAIAGPNLDDTLPPPAWSFGATAEQADESLDLVLRGVKTATASAFRDYQLENEELPQVGSLSIILDGAGFPRALIRTFDVQIVRFDKVGEEHAYAEGEGDRSLNHWRAVHEWFFKEYDAHTRGFSKDMRVVLERFELLVPTPTQVREHARVDRSTPQ